MNYIIEIGVFGLTKLLFKLSIKKSLAYSLLANIFKKLIIKYVFHYEFVSANDVTYYSDKKETDLAGIGFILLEKPINFNKLQCQILDNIVKNDQYYGRLKKIIVKKFDFAFWKTPSQFNINNHVQYINLSDK